MKKNIVFPFLFLLLQSLCAQHSGLRQSVSLDLHQKPLSDAFTLITQQTGIRFSYNSQQINENRKISIRVENRELSKVLPLILPASVSFKLVGKYIILSVREPKKKTAPLHTDIPENVQDQPGNSSFIKNNPDSIRLIDSTEVFLCLKNSFLNSGIILDSCHRVITLINEEEMNKKLALLALSATIAGSQISAQTKTSKTESPMNQVNMESLANQKKEETRTVVETDIKGKRAAQVSFIYPVGTDGINSADYEYNTSFNVIGGRTGKVSGFELASVFNINKYSSEGVQLAGVMNHTGTLGNNEQSRNVQIAGVYNFTLNGVSTQIGGVINRTEKSPAQIVGVFNLADAAIIQIAGVANVSKKNNAQIAGIVNAADTACAQISGVINLANSSSLQLSTINITRKGGFQLGVVNVRDTADGISLGVINIVKKGGLMEVEAGGSESLHAMLSFRSGTQKLYSIITAGYNFSDNVFATGFGLGTEITLKNRWRLNIEGIHYNLYNKNFGNWSDSDDGDFREWDDYNYAGLTQLRPTINYKFAGHFKIYAGPTLNLLIMDTDLNSDFKAPYSIWNTTGDDVKLDAWIGFTAGIRF
ncbi:MAG: hypothetical protein LBR52_06060 [Prevotellaceae bacterium]|jgi:hypothetical protein|nr:hypothetical protein [Prevotellaceae bacterium]